MIGNLRRECGGILSGLGLLLRGSRRSLCVGRSLLLRLGLLLLVLLLLLLARRTDRLRGEVSGRALREALAWGRVPAWRGRTVELRRGAGEAVRTGGRTEARVALWRRRVTVRRERWGLLWTLRTLGTAPLLLLLLLLLVGLREGALRTRWWCLRCARCAVGSCGLNEIMSASSLVIADGRCVVMYSSEGRQRSVHMVLRSRKMKMVYIRNVSS